jgi:hypothetical protein
MSELQTALNVREGDKNPQGRPTHEDIVVEICESFIQYDERSGLVRLSHTRVRDFLEEKYSESLWSETDLAVVCLTYLSFDVFREAECETEQAAQERIVQYPFGPYAASYWGQHVQGEGETDPRIWEGLLELLRSHQNLAAITQMIDLKPEEWEDVPPWPRYVGWIFIHVLSRYGLVKLAKKFLDSNIVAPPIIVVPL